MQDQPQDLKWVRFFLRQLPVYKFSSVKHQTRQQTRLQRERELRSRPHNQPAAVSSPPPQPGPSSGPLRAGKRKITEAYDDAPEDVEEGRRPSPFHPSPSRSQSDLKNTTPHTPDLSRNRTLNAIIAALPEEARLFLDKVAKCAESPLELEMLSVILKSAGEIYEQCSASARSTRSTPDELTTSQSVEPLHSSEESEEINDNIEGVGDLPQTFQVSQEIPPNPHHPDPMATIGEHSGMTWEVSTSPLDEARLQDVDDVQSISDLQSICDIDSLSNLEADVGDADHTVDTPTIHHAIPWSHLATSAASYARRGKQGGAALDNDYSDISVHATSSAGSRSADSASYAPSYTQSITRRKVISNFQRHVTRERPEIQLRRKMKKTKAKQAAEAAAQGSAGPASRTRSKTARS